MPIFLLFRLAVLGSRKAASDSLPSPPLFRWSHLSSFSTAGPKEEGAALIKKGEAFFQPYSMDLFFSVFSFPLGFFE